jgi:D-beta-D-heptose 7-phosphate kinase/D-beta-D-heptose 1-phosphate adenosyltransferase
MCTCLTNCARRQTVRRIVVTLSQLLALRTPTETLVATCGCFDLLHVGHVRFLDEAKTLGDRLVVAINDDESVRRLKGEGRPVVPHAERMELVSALRSVDWVVGFSEPTPAELLRAVAPDVFCKGGDYAVDDLPERLVVEERGGRVAVLSHFDVRSTTGLVDRMRERA